MNFPHYFTCQVLNGLVLCDVLICGGYALGNAEKFSATLEKVVFDASSDTIRTSLLPSAL